MKNEKLTSFEELPQEFLDILASVCRSSDWCLDLGTGEGRVAFVLAERARWTLGIDRIPPKIEEARRIAQNNGIANVQFIVGDLENMFYSDLAPIGVFQVIASNLCVSREILKRSDEALDQAGYIVGVCLSEDNWSKELGFEENHFTEKSLKEILGELSIKTLSISRHEKILTLNGVEEFVKSYLKSYPIATSEEALKKMRDLAGGEKNKPIEIKESKLIFCARKS